jgi:IS5 family transposase
LGCNLLFGGLIKKTRFQEVLFGVVEIQGTKKGRAISEPAFDIYPYPASENLSFHLSILPK